MTVSVDLDHRPPLTFYLSVGLVAGSIIALQIGIMRVFSVGSWAHFGSLVVSLAMFGFGLTSAIMCVAKGWFERHWERAIKGALLAFGPLMVVCNLAAQQVPFNAIFLISDPMQKWRLLANFVLYFLPFLAGALYLGVVFLKARKSFNRVYFADLVGSGLCGLSVLLAMYFFRPDDLIMAPLLLWLLGGVLWFLAIGDRRGITPTCFRGGNRRGPVAGASAAKAWHPARGWHGRETMPQHHTSRGAAFAILISTVEYKGASVERWHGRETMPQLMDHATTGLC